MLVNEEFSISIEFHHNVAAYGVRTSYVAFQIDTCDCRKRLG